MNNITEENNFPNPQQPLTAVSPQGGVGPPTVPPPSTTYTDISNLSGYSQLLGVKSATVSSCPEKLTAHVKSIMNHVFKKQLTPEFENWM